MQFAVRFTILLHFLRQTLHTYLFLHSMKHSWSSLLSQTPQSRQETKHSCHLALDPTAYKMISRGHYSSFRWLRMCVRSVAVYWPDELFPCCRDEEAVLCPHNVNVLSTPATQLHLSWKQYPQTKLSISSDWSLDLSPNKMDKMSKNIYERIVWIIKRSISNTEPCINADFIDSFLHIISIK